MKKILNALISSALFVIVFLFVGYVAFIAMIAYGISESLGFASKNFYLANASTEVFNIEISSEEELLYKGSIEPNSEIIFEYKAINDAPYDIIYTIGEDVSDKKSLNGSFCDPISYYILLNSKSEVTIKTLSTRSINNKF